MDLHIVPFQINFTIKCRQKLEYEMWPELCAHSIAPGINLPERHLQFDLDDMYNFVEICESRNSWVIQCLNYNGDWILDKLVIDLIIAVPTLTKNTKARMAKKGTLNFILSNVLVVLTIITLHNQFALFQFLFSLIKLFCLDSFSMNMLSKNC